MGKLSTESLVMEVFKKQAGLETSLVIRSMTSLLTGLRSIAESIISSRRQISFVRPELPPSILHLSEGPVPGSRENGLSLKIKSLKSSKPLLKQFKSSFQI